MELKIDGSSLHEFQINKYFLPDTKFQSFDHEKNPALCTVTVTVVMEDFSRPSPSPQKDRDEMERWAPSVHPEMSPTRDTE